jgi:hypothetical protein
MRIGDGHPGGAQNALARAVPGLEDLDDGGRRGALGQVGLSVHEGLVDGGVELLADLAVPGQAEPLQNRLQLLGDRGERTTLQVAVLPGEVDVVQDRQERLENARHRLVAGDVPVAVDPAAVVDELGLQALQVGQPLGGRCLSGVWSPSAW